MRVTPKCCRQESDDSGRVGGEREVETAAHSFNQPKRQAADQFGIETVVFGERRDRKVSHVECDGRKSTRTGGLGQDVFFCDQNGGKPQKSLTQEHV